MKHTKKSRIFSLLLCCLMLLGILPLGQVAYAAGDEYTVKISGSGGAKVGFEGGTIDVSTKTQKFKEGASVTVISEPLNNNWIFEEWVDRHGNHQDGWSTHTFTMPAHDIDVIAKYREKRHFFLTYASNGGSGGMSSAFVDEGDSYTFPENGFTPPTGKRFNYWVVSDGSHSYNYGQLSTADLGVLFNYSLATFPAGSTLDITVSPYWKDIECTVKFNVLGHGTAPTSQSVTYNHTATKPADPTASGWNFGGWYKEQGFINAFDFSTPITGNITLYAKWTPDSSEKIIDEIRVDGFVSPVVNETAGDHLSLTVPTNCHYAIEQKDWYCEEDNHYLSGGEVFEAGKTYSCRITLRADDGYDFADGAQFFINDSTEKVDTNPEHTFTYTYTDGSKKACLWTVEEKLAASFAFTTQPVSGTAKKTESFTFSWAISQTPDSMWLQVWSPEDGDWAGLSGSLLGETSHSVSYVSMFADGNVSKYRIAARKGSEDIFSNEFTVTWTDDSSTFAFTTQPVSGTAKITESYTFSWAISQTPDSVWLQVWSPEDGDWAGLSGSLLGETSHSVSYVSMFADGNVSKYRIAARKGSEDIFSNEFTVTWTDDSSTFAFTTQPVSGTAKITESYTFSWAINQTPDSVWLQVWSPEDGDWAGLSGSLLGETSHSVSYVSMFADENVSKYRIAARKGAEDIFSNEFTVTWLFDMAPDTYTVTFDANGHGTAPTAQTVEDGKTATKPADPTASGWTFKGWYQDKTCSIPFNFATPITGNITLYAKWTENGGTVTPDTYTVTFDANGHGTAPAAQTVEDGKTATKPADPTASGWTFKGWYKDKDCKNAFDFSTPITGNITLYAKWAQNSGGQDQSPKTGDDSNLGLWIALMAVSMIGIGGATVFGRKKRTNR